MVLVTMEIKYCLCGCEKEVKNNYIRGHYNKNNSKSIRKMVETRKNNGSYINLNKGKHFSINTEFKKNHKINEGKKYKPISEEKRKNMGQWNVGLTKETDERVKNSSEKVSITNTGKIRSEEAKNNYSLSKIGEKNPMFGKYGELNPNYIIDKQRDYTLDFNVRFKEKIRERENNCCLICNMDEKQEKLSIHHVDYNKLNSFEQNCVALCRSCHTKTNHNRNQWKTFFQSLLKERYNYEFSEEQKIILDFTNLEEKQ